MLREATLATKSIPRVVFGALLAIGPLENSTKTQAAKAYYWLKQLKGVKLTQENELKKLVKKENLELPSESTTREYLCEMGYSINLAAREDW